MVREQLQRTVEEEIMEAVKGVMETMQSIVPPYIIFAFLLRCVRDICWNAREEKVDWVLNSVSDSISSAPDLEELKKRFRQIVHAEMERLNERPEGSGDDAIGRAISYIRIHYAEPIRSAEVARMFFIDPAYFSKQFKKRMGVNYNDFVTDLRMKKAQRLLHLGWYSVAEVAGMVGYKSQRHFSRLFKAHMGCYPSELPHK
ncbi:MAG: helix-turn-helix transcriptional regulator [Clostridiales bacterium]|nr:helix-turn-helix transcriptional regulator [Clostridiales bacterium]